MEMIRSRSRSQSRKQDKDAMVQKEFESKQKDIEGIVDSILPGGGAGASRGVEYGEKSEHSEQRTQH